MREREAMPESPTTLHGWEQMADYLGTSVRTAQRWADDFDLPVRRSTSGRATVEASREEVDRWVRSQTARPPDADAANVEDGQPLSRRRPARVWRRLGVGAALAVSTVVAVALAVTGRDPAPTSAGRDGTTSAAPRTVLFSVDRPGKVRTILGASESRPARSSLPDGRWIEMRPRHVDGDTIEVTLSLVEESTVPAPAGGIGSVTVAIRMGQPVTLGLAGGVVISISWTEVGG
jgi:hypothetical protein